GKRFSIGRFFLRTPQNPVSCGSLWLLESNLFARFSRFRVCPSSSFDVQLHSFSTQWKVIDCNGLQKSFGLKPQGRKLFWNGTFLFKIKMKYLVFFFKFYNIEVID